MKLLNPKKSKIMTPTDLRLGHNDFDIADVEENVVHTCLGHNDFEEEKKIPQISRSLLSMAYKEDKAKLRFGVVDIGNGPRPVVFIDDENSYIDLLSGRVLMIEFMVVEEYATVSYYGGTFKFHGENGTIAFIDKEILVKNYGLGIIKD